MITSLPGILCAQLTTGTIVGTVRDEDRKPQTAVTLILSNGAGFRVTMHSGPDGEFSATVPYGSYELSSEGSSATPQFRASIVVSPLQSTRIDITLNGAPRAVEVKSAPETPPGQWTDTPRDRTYPEAFGLQGLLLSREPAAATEPLDFTGLKDSRLGVLSQRGLSWAGTQYRIAGMDATDSFEPGRAAILPDRDSLEAIVTRSGFAQTTSTAYSTEVGLFLPRAAESWHGAASTAETGSVLASGNLPPPPGRGILQQPEEFRWFTRDHVEAGGPLTKSVNLFAAGAGQWGSQTVPIAAAGTSANNLGTRELFGDLRLLVQARTGDQLEFQYSGSRLDLSGWGAPAGIEDLASRRMTPFFTLPWGFASETESDNFNSLQLGWTHELQGGSGWGALETRYSYSVAHLDTASQSQAASQQSRIELLGGGATGAPPLTNLGSRTRQQIASVWQPSVFRAGGARQQILIAAGWESSSPRNRFAAPFDMNVITANGAPAFAVQFNTPVDSREMIRTGSVTLGDHLALGRTFSIDLGAAADFARGSLPAQSSPAGTFAAARMFGPRADLIAWNQISPRAGFSWLVPHAHGLVLRGAYFRVYAPLAGSYLDFANPNSLSGSVYRWSDPNGDGLFQPGELGPLLLNFGGSYSSISPSLKRPYADEFDIGGQIDVARWLAVRMQLFRRDDKRRIAAIDTGVTSQAFSPRPILDPGPDGIPGTFDDQRLTVYEQNPATFGQDRYLLTNPAGLRTLNKGALMQIDARGRRITFRALFVAEESDGNNSPGDSVFTNDPGVIDTSLLDPNAGIFADGRGFMDRAFVGKLLWTYRLPAKLGGVQLASATNYLDGLVFARYLLVTGLAQGPFLAASTSRGTQQNNPQGGNRAQAIINWNLRLQRSFPLPTGKLSAAVDLLNVVNGGYKIRESDLSGTSFNLRLPTETQPPRFARLELRYEF